MTFCQVPNCPDPAHWRCSSGFRFCIAHKKGHGTPPHTFKRYVHPTKAKRTTKNPTKAKRATQRAAHRPSQP